MLLGSFFSLRVNVDYRNDSLVCCNWPVASNWYHLSSYRCNDLVINRQFIALTLTLCDKSPLPGRRGGSKWIKWLTFIAKYKSWLSNFMWLLDFKVCFVCVSSEPGRTLRSSRSPWQVNVDHQRREALWLGSLRLWSPQQDRRPSEEHVPGHWMWALYIFDQCLKAGIWKGVKSQIFGWTA